ncbi:hypothetical protein EG328_007698 [Venturia inaequalis]|uniref:Uncharacterized protein n=1 Tax=Venturia inaequalis TaxID=5025 RepID=A0A8H3UYJ3_VENIN|nr:hypothetical protein EG328_007698 [Venturia inaequalis]KAE9978725.1 hypothetical protein EG327_007286 [Venturia inaequalis]
MSSSSPVRKFKVEPVETTTKSSRKFVPQPVETTTISSKSRRCEAVASASTKKLTPQLIETTISSSKRRKDNPSPEPRKFIPQLVNVTKRSRHPEEENSACSTADATSTEASLPDNKVKRLFAPQLIDTAKRTRKAGDTRPAHLPSDRTDALPSSLDGLRQFRQKVLDTPPPPENTPAGMLSPTVSSAEARRIGIPLPRRQISQLTQASTRQHSFRVPELECIDSSESEEDDSPCMSTSPSSASDVSFRHATRMRESIDASSSGYLLELAAKAAEQQLREQALAAFPNDDRHTTVDHYIGRESSTTAASIAGTRSEYDHRHFGSFNWDLKDMRKHHEQLEAKKEKEQAEKEARRNRLHRGSNHGPWGNPFTKSTPGNAKQKDNEMERMRRKARPPMLGDDIEFPRCRSPSPARFDVTQGSTFLRAQMCYLTEHADDPIDRKETLWKIKESSTTVRTSMWSQSSSRAPSPGGLWGGCCRGGTGFSPPRGPTGLMTPHHIYDEAPNPMDTIANPMFRQNLPSPPPSNFDVTLTNEKVDTERAIEDEFNDEFITQVYNYLSLGYPSLARKYDDELSKISCTPLSDLRCDDSLATSKGYIRLGDDECGKQDGIDKEMCARWKSLRTYIHEWARQQPCMAQPQNQQGFGASVRRGSWAW